MPKTHTLSLVIEEHDRPDSSPNPYALITSGYLYLGPRTVINLDMETRDGDLMTILQKAKRQVDLAISELEGPV